MKSAGQILFKFAVVVALAFVAQADQARAQSVQRIAAIVNDELITAYDLETRMKLVILSTRLPDTIEVRRRIGGQILRTLIDERLQMQEAVRLLRAKHDAELAAMKDMCDGALQMLSGMDESLPAAVRADGAFSATGPEAEGDGGGGSG